MNQDIDYNGTTIRVIDRNFPDWHNCTFYLLWKQKDTQLYSFGDSPEDVIAKGYLRRTQFEICKHKN